MTTSSFISTSLKKMITFIVLALVFSSCQESEFYEKKFLKGAGVEDEQVPETDLTEKDPRIGDNHTDDGTDADVRSPSDDGESNDDSADENTGPHPQDDQNQDDQDENDQDQNQDQNDPGDEQPGDQDDNTQTPNPDNNSSQDDPDTGQTDDQNTDQDQDTSSDNDEDSGQTSHDEDNDTEEDPVDNEQTDSSNNDTDSTGPSNDDDQASGDQGDNQDSDQETDQDDSGQANLEEVHESFQQREKNQKVDILWVIDDSGSMKDEQEALAYNFETFIKDFMKKDIDFRMTITTTDPTRRVDGKMMCNWRNLSSQYAKNNPENFYRRFKSCVKVGTRGHGREKGLRAVKSFLQKYEHHALRNGSFLREDAYLSVVFVSDEEDQSYKGTDFYLERMREIKRQEGLVKAYSIVTTEETGRRWETVGNRYIDVSKQTAGKVANIKGDFHKILNNFGGDIVDLAASFALSQRPHEDIQVKVNGEDVAEGWTYNSDNRSIKFDEDSLPSAGSIIDVSYKVKKQ